MKSIQVEQLVPKTVFKYEARDGRIFDYSWECESYEAQLDEAALMEIETCSEINGCAPFDGGENMEYHSYRWFRPKNEDEIERLKTIYGEDKFCNADIGHWLCIDSGDYGEAWVSTLDASISYAKSMPRNHY